MPIKAGLEVNNFPPGFFYFMTKGTGKMADFITKSNPVNLIIAGVVFLCAIVIVVKTIKELTLKIGNNTVSFSSKKTQSEIVKVVTDYADFKYKIKDEQQEGVQDLHEQAKRVVAVQLDQYTRRLTTDYIQALNEHSTENNLTINVFSLMIQILYNKMYKFCMDIYEKNHLKDKTDIELKELASMDYIRLSDIFREFMQVNWFKELGDYEILHNVCEMESSFVKGLVLQILTSFRDLSRQKYELINTVNDIDCKVREKVQKTGNLPTNAISILSDLYIPGTGLNKKSVENWLMEN